jgi:HK97 family phage major capsid protein
LADANINLVQFIIQLFAEAIGLAEDKAFFTGSGSGQPKGITTESIATRTPNGSSPSIDDVIDLIDAVPQRVVQSPKAAFVGNRNVKRAFRKVKDTTGAYIWRDGGAAQSSNGETQRLPDQLYGYTFYEQNDLPNNQLFFGDWSMYIIGDRQTVAVQTTTEGVLTE